MSNLFSQNLGNEWINYSQKYFKVKVAEDGIYRISRQALVNANISIDAIPLYNLQLFSKGEEQAIYIKVDSYGVLEYIEFFGEKNTGWFDIGLYPNEATQTNPYYSLINDTNVYFFTWNSSTNNKRITSVTETNFSSYTPAPYCFVNSFQQYASKYFNGNSYSEYGKAEGWFDTEYAIGTTKAKTLSTKNIYSLGPDAIFSIAAVSTSNASSSNGYFNHHFKIECLDFSFDTTFWGYSNIKKTFKISPSNITEATTVKFSSINDLGATTDYNAASYVKIKYPHTFDFENKTDFRFSIPSNTSKTYIEISNLNSSGNTILYDITNSKRVKVVDESSLHKAIIPQVNLESDCYIVDEDSIKYLEVIPVNSNSSSYALFTNYVSIYNNTEYLIISDSKLWNEALNYKNYRNSSGYITNLVNIEQLYDQFAYGIVKHPLAIRNFIDKSLDSWNDLKYLFLLGKSVGAYYHRNSAYAYKENHIPSFGYPASDNLLINGIHVASSEIPIGIGRLAAFNEEEIKTYLNKVIDYELNTPSKWMKNIIHFGGGNDEYEQAAFAGYLDNYKAIIEDSLFGGTVTTFLKNSSEPIQLSQSDTVEILINSGTSLITFFGHGYSGGFDQSIDDPSAFYNKAKYPLLLANSCLTGDIHMSSKSISEIWVLIQDKGSIGFLSTTSQGNSYYLDKFSNEFYRNITYKNYAQPVGKSIKNTFTFLYDNYSANQSLLSSCLQFNLHGDPAIILNSFEKPDLTIESSSISFNPIQITTNDDNFEINIDILNLGKAIHDSFIVSVTRKYPDGSSENNNYVVEKCIGHEILNVILPVNPLKAAGVNEFEIYIDAMQEIDELLETNNQYTATIIITSDDITPIYPYNYSIFPDSIVSLKASVGDPFLNNFDYVFEIDTTDLFSAPLASQNFYSTGGVIEWQVPFELQDTTVYFWRVSKIPSGEDSYNWKESSFIYIKNKTGWSQAHFFQFKHDTYSFIDYNRNERKFNYILTPKELVCRNIGKAYGEDEWRRVSYYVDGVGDFTSCGTTPAILVAVLDSLTLESWFSNRGDFGHVNYEKCWSRSRLDKYFIFPSADSTYRNSLINFIENDIPDGNYVIMYSFRYGYFQQWSPEQHSFFESLSNNPMQISNVPDDYPYILFFQKGNLNSVEEVVGTHNRDDITLTHPFPRSFYYGEIESVKFGPSTKWEALRWRQNPLESSSNDESSLILSGVTESGLEQDLLTNITEEDTVVYNLNTSVDANQYPFVKLLMKNRDDFTQTPAQLKKWQLISDLAPETAINIEKGFYFYNDTINEGDSVVFAIATENISDFDMDSLLIKYHLQNFNNEFSLIKEIRKRPHPSGDVLIDTLKYSTAGLTGLNSIWVEVNPINSETGAYDQVEQYHFNNIAQVYFYINSDITNPLLDVIFDGIHIMDGEIVSAKPQIVVSLKDENKFLALNDTSVFKVFLKSETDESEKRIYFNNIDGTENMKWIPAELPQNSCKVIYEPVLADGKYQLKIQAKDVSNNESGEYDYNISFEVINEATITEIFNYPNPFSTKTRFVFTLTGSEIPDEFSIQIFTISGKLVKIISLEDLGNIHVGNNITEYYWDGTDTFGDKLANGVYFYKVITKLNGEPIEKRQTDTEKYFNNGIGKLYIMR